ncbi:anthranilate synthase component II [Salinicoccus siamensis]|uniref:Anthranilate synthase component II n=1 Tax=Salinicoccus siamensis TaxID=381830 RepID=A0ABV5Z3R2_9STAP
MKLLMIDNYDSFTYNIIHYLEKARQDIEVVTITPAMLDFIDMKDIAGMIISPGPSHPGARPEVIDFVGRYWGTMPILGVCLGHQMLWHMCGGRVAHGSRPIHGHTFEISHDGGTLFKGLPERFSVTRYHSLTCLGEVPEGLMVSAWTDEGDIMAIRHKSLPIYGMQYHPESILSEWGLDQLRLFIEEMEKGEENASPYKI